MLKRLTARFAILRKLLQKIHLRKERSERDRKAVRKALPISVMLHLPGKSPLMVQAIDISVGGMGIVTSDHLPPGHNVRIALQMFFRGKMRRAGVSARVANCTKSRTGEFKTGLQFINLSQFESTLFSKYVAS